MTKQVAIIGGGLAGVATTTHLAAELIRQKQVNVKIVVFEPRQEVGPGLAYATNLPDCFLLNHETDHMGSVSLSSTDPKNDKDFYQWVQQHKSELKPTYPKTDLENPRGFVPRSLYGRYLEARFKETVEMAKANHIEIEVRHQPVTRLERGKAGMMVTAGEGSAAKSEPFAACVLALGNWYRPMPKKFAASGTAFSAYPPDTFLSANTVPKGGTLLVQGTGLTGVDATIAALEGGRYGHVIMTSHRGQLRAVRGEKKPYSPKHLTLANLETLSRRKGDGTHFRLEDVITLLQEELKEAFGKDVSWDDITRPKDMKIFLQTMLSDYDAKREMRWRSVVDSFDPIRQEVFNRMTPKDQIDFMDNWQNLYLSYRAAMPAENARKLLHYMGEGKLEVVGGLGSVVQEHGKYVLRAYHDADGRPIVRPDARHATPKDAVETKREADGLVFALAQSRDVMLVPVLKRAVDKGIAQAHSAGGLVIDQSSCRVMPRDKAQASQPLFALGQLTSGYQMNPPNTLDIARASHVVAGQVASEVAKGRGTGNPGG